jgi:hypothetical protein
MEATLHLHANDNQMTIEQIYEFTPLQPNPLEDPMIVVYDSLLHLYNNMEADNNDTMGAWIAD